MRVYDIFHAEYVKTRFLQVLSNVNQLYQIDIEVTNCEK